MREHQPQVCTYTTVALPGDEAHGRGREDVRKLLREAPYAERRCASRPAGVVINLNRSNVLYSLPHARLSRWSQRSNRNDPEPTLECALRIGSWCHARRHLGVEFRGLQCGAGKVCAACGSWAGNGSINFASGSKEKARCRAHFAKTGAMRCWRHGVGQGRSVGATDDDRRQQLRRPLLQRAV